MDFVNYSAINQKRNGGFRNIEKPINKMNAAGLSNQMQPVGRWFYYTGCILRAWLSMATRAQS